MANIETTLRIPEENWPKFIAGILKEHPIPTELVLDEKGNPTYNEDGTEITKPMYTEVQWATKLATDYLEREFRQGSKKLAIEAMQLDEQKVQEIKENIL